MPADGITVYTCSIHNDSKAELLNLKYVITGGIPYTVENCPDTLAAGAVARDIKITLSGVDILANMDQINAPRCGATYDMLWTF